MSNIRVCCPIQRGKNKQLFRFRGKEPLIMADDFGRRVELVPYALGRRPGRCLPRVLSQGQVDLCRIAALPPELARLLPASPPLAIADGRCLNLALLPLLLDRAIPGWRGLCLGLRADSGYVCLAALRLGGQARSLALSGPWAHRLANYLYTRYGIAALVGPGDVEADLTGPILRPQSLLWQDDVLPMEMAEAILLSSQQTPLVADPSYWERLCSRALRCGCAPLAMTNQEAAPTKRRR